MAHQRRERPRREPHWIVQATVTAIINQLAPGVLGSVSTILIFIRAGIVDRDRLNVGILLLVLAVSGLISFVSFALGVRYTVYATMHALVTLFGRGRPSDAKQKRSVLKRLLLGLQVLVWWAAFLPDFFLHRGSDVDEPVPDDASEPQRPSLADTILDHVRSLNPPPTAVPSRPTLPSSNPQQDRDA